MRAILFLLLAVFARIVYAADAPADNAVPQLWRAAESWSQPYCKGFDSESAVQTCIKSRWQSMYPQVSSCTFSKDPTRYILYVSGMQSDGATCNGSATYETYCPDQTTKPDADGKCRDLACPGNQTRPEGSVECICNADRFNRLALFKENLSGEGWLPDTACSGSCEFTLGEGMSFGGKSWIAQRGKMTGKKCVDAPVGSGSASPKPPVVVPETKKPPCSPFDGVVTTNDGRVLCVPEGTPDAPKPKVDKKTKQETYPDGSTKNETTTTTTDPSSGATATTTTSTSSGGQSGPSGTTTTEVGSSKTVPSDGTGGNGDGDGGDGGCDPTLNFCDGPETKDLYSKGTDKLDQVFGEFRTKMEGSDIYKAGSGFFQVTIPAGACPAVSAPVPYLNITLDLSVLCAPFIIQALDAAGYVVLFIASFVAFGWAFL